jgi:ring-1,2-phenylacetyl-CoA epoxidase subunit PaaC
LSQVLTAATLRRPSPPAPSPAGVRGGRDGVHTPALAEILSEMQGLARSVPGGLW